MFTVEKIEGVFAVKDWNGEIVIAYRSKKHAEAYKRGVENEIIGEAERYNERFDAVRAYLAARKNRVYEPVAQMELF